MELKDFAKEADLLKTLGHSIRLNIINVLLEEDACVKNIWGCLDIPQATVSQHLAILKSKGIVMAHREGVTVRYSVRDPRMKKIIEALKEQSQ
ncbi:MAG: winged helix-turn-helix transcriptional regulator [Deltaproteobacteria bacterium]|nr:MAG: winged helix-turn-helix transcriptional regulator [Deltaproteobacteria bacterium]